MRPTFQILLLSISLLVLSACEDPFILAAGGELSGTVTETPDSWQLDKDSAVAQLETRPEDPYSIKCMFLLRQEKYTPY